MAEPPLDKADPAVRARLAAFRAKYPRNEFIRIGATVYHAQDSMTRSLVTYRPNSGEQPVTLWSSAIKSNQKTYYKYAHQLLKYRPVDLAGGFPRGYGRFEIWDITRVAVDAEISLFPYISQIIKGTRRQATAPRTEQAQRHGTLCKALQLCGEIES